MDYMKHIDYSEIIDTEEQHKEKKSGKRIPMCVRHTKEST